MNLNRKGMAETTEALSPKKIATFIIGIITLILMFSLIMLAVALL